MRERNNYPPEFKAKIVLELLREEKTISQIVSETGIHATVLSRWKAEALKRLPELFTKGESESEKMKKEFEAKEEEYMKAIGELTMDLNFLKKVESVFGLEERKEMIEWEKPDKKEAKIAINKQCQLLSISRSTAYYKPLGPSDDEIRIKNLIDRIYTAEPTYGARRISNTLRKKYGVDVGRKRARTYMREMGIDAICPGPNLSKRCKQHHTYPYLLRKVPITHNNHVWGIDLSYIGTETGFTYLVVIIYWHSHFVVGWGMSNTMHVDFVKTALEKAFMEHGTPDIINSDQGSQFTCPAYIDLIKSKETIRISMNGKGRATDNAITERFFRNLKQEELYREEIYNGRDAYRHTEKYIRKYNWERGHQSLEYRTPSQVYMSLDDVLIAV